MSTKPNPNPNPMRHCGRGSGCSQHYLNYDAKVYNWSLPKIYSTEFHKIGRKGGTRAMEESIRLWW